MKREVLSISYLQELAPKLNNKRGERLLRWLFRTFKVNEINDLYGRCCDHQGAAFSEAIIKDLNITCQIDNAERLEHLPEGAFITVSNHPFGALDGVILVKLIAEHRPAYKVMANWILKLVEPLANNFIAVDPNANRPGVSRNGIREALAQTKAGEPLGFFPAGAVSMLTPTLKIEDQTWHPNIMRIIQQVKKPVVPIFFHGHNTFTSNILGLINWNLRSLRLPIEILKKSNQTLRISIGEPIQPGTLAQYKTPEELGVFLKQETYKLKELAKKSK